MPAKKTNFIPYSCFAYYNDKFIECLKCKHNKSCKKATESMECEDVRKMYKYKKSQIDDLVKKFGNDK